MVSAFPEDFVNISSVYPHSSHPKSYNGIVFPFCNCYIIHSTMFLFY
jgi:hypothetical protein